MQDLTSETVAGQRRLLLVTLALGLSSFLTQFDVTAVVVAMPAVAKSVGFGVAGFAWVIDAYSLAFTGALLASGALGDRFGRRRCMLIGNATFLVASLACGIAWNGAVLLAARAVQGVGAAFMVTGAISLVAGVFTEPNRRARAFGVIGVISGVAMALGPTLGGVLASWFGWRWIFLVNIPFCATLAFAVPRLVAETKNAEGRPLDPVGIALLTVSLGLGINALLQREGPPIERLAMLVGSLTAAILFGWQQWRSSRPVLDPRVFATALMSGIGVLLTAVQFGYWAILVYLPLFLSTALSMSLDTAGVALLAATLPMLVIPVIGGHLATQWGWRRLFTVAYCLIAVGNVLLAVSALSDSAATRMVTSIAGMAAMGVGAALANPQLSSVVLANVPPAQAGMASAVTMIARQAGFAISVAVIGTTLGSTIAVTAGFSKPFFLAALIAVGGVVAAWILLPAKSSQRII